MVAKVMWTVREAEQQVENLQVGNVARKWKRAHCWWISERERSGWSKG